MDVFDKGFLEDMGNRFEIDLAGAVTVDSKASVETARFVLQFIPNSDRPNCVRAVFEKYIHARKQLLVLETPGDVNVVVCIQAEHD